MSYQPDVESVRAALEEVVPAQHWRNVGRVAVHAAWIEESAPLILYAAGGALGHVARTPAAG